MVNKTHKYWGLELDRQVRILDTTLDPRVRAITIMLMFKSHPEGRHEEADIITEIVQDHQLEPEDMADVFDKFDYLIQEGLL